MPVLIDTHVHIYPFYDLRLTLDSLRNNLGAAAPGASCMAFLAERNDCRFFRDFSRNASGMLGSRVRVDARDAVVRLVEPGFTDLYIVAGRQIITRERLEILALMTDTVIEDNLPARDVLARVRTENGIPVISWAPGKWFFARGKVIESILDENAPGTLLIGDTTLRPIGWPTPVLMDKAVNRGFTVVAGSDPLPVPGEETQAGRYGILLETGLDPDDPLASIRALLTTPGFMPSRIGRRGSPWQTLRRLFKNARAKKSSFA